MFLQSSFTAKARRGRKVAVLNSLETDKIVTNNSTVPVKIRVQSRQKIYQLQGTKIISISKNHP